jgi:DNA polymerase I-like protein with 3'-5' exonuclease and polymerase domains
MSIILDIETNSTHDKIWCVVTRDIDKQDVRVWYENHFTLQNYLNSVTKIITHNGIFFDFPVLKKIWKIQVKKSQVVDTLVLSRLYNPSLEDGHSLASWGQRLGFPKGEFTDFDGGISDEMIKYCEQDTLVTAKLYKHLTKEMQNDFSQKSIELEHQVAIIIAEQERNGFKLDERAATQLLCELKTKLESIKVEMESIFPPRIESGRTNKKTGKPLKDIITPFNPGSRQQIAERLQEKGWKPKKFTEKGSVIIDEDVLDQIIKECSDE